MTLNGVIAIISCFSPNSIALQTDYVTVVEDRPIMSTKYRLPVPVFYFWPKLTHPAARPLCDSCDTCYAFLNNSRQTTLCFPVFHAAFNAYFAWRDFSSIAGGISMKLGTTIHHARGNCCKVFWWHRSKVKVIEKPNSSFRKRDSHQLTAVRPLSVRRGHTDRRCDVEAVLYYKSPYVSLILRILNVGYAPLVHLFMPPTTIVSGEHYVLGLSVRLSVRPLFAVCKLLFCMTRYLST